MKKPEITPGKWAAEFGGLPGIFAGCDLIATMESRKQKENEANATAIASLPDLLEALEQARELVSICRSRLPKSVKNPDTFKLCLADAAIHKALAKAGYTF